MDNGIVVAISALGTALIGGIITLLSKVIDAFQKKNEQAMIIKTTYVNKKLEAGQIFVARNNVLIYNFYYQISHLEEMKATGKKNNEILSNINDIQVALKDNYISKNDAIELFFDISDSNAEYDIVMNALGKEAVRLNESELGTSTFIEHADAIIALYRESIDIILKGSATVRNELKSYDVI